MQTSVFFDGVCSLCNRGVNFLISKDKKGVLKFASLQSEYAQNVVPKALLDRDNLDTIIVYTDGKFYERSKAVLKLCKVLGGGFYVFLIDTSSPVLFGMVCIGLSPTTVTTGLEKQSNVGFQQWI